MDTDNPPTRSGSPWKWVAGLAILAVLVLLGTMIATDLGGNVTLENARLTAGASGNRVVTGSLGNNTRRV